MMQHQPEETRTADAKTYDLGHWDQGMLSRALMAAIERDEQHGLSGECAKRLLQIFTTDGTVSVTVRDLTV